MLFTFSKYFHIHCLICCSWQPCEIGGANGDSHFTLLRWGNRGTIKWWLHHFYDHDSDHLRDSRPATMTCDLSSLGKVAEVVELSKDGQKRRTWKVHCLVDTLLNEWKLSFIDRSLWFNYTHEAHWSSDWASGSLPRSLHVLTYLNLRTNLSRYHY